MRERYSEKLDQLEFGHATIEAYLSHIHKCDPSLNNVPLAYLLYAPPTIGVTPVGPAYSYVHRFRKWIKDPDTVFKLCLDSPADEWPFLILSDARPD